MQNKKIATIWMILVKGVAGYTLRNTCLKWFFVMNYISGLFLAFLAR